MDNKEFESLAEQTIKELQAHLGTMNIRDISIWKSHYDKSDYIRNKLLQYGLTTYNPNFRDNIILTQKGFEFESFEKERQEKADRKKLEEDQIRSIINTNNSVSKTNNFQRLFGVFSLIIGGLTMVFILITTYKQYRDNTAQELQDIKIQLQKIDTTLKHTPPYIPAIDSSTMK